jgi:hypothetical protein
LQLKERNVTNPSKQAADLDPQEHDLQDEPHSEINEDPAQQRNADVQEVQQTEPTPGVSEPFRDTGPEASIPSDDAGPTQQQLAQSEQERKMQNILSL